MFNQCSFLRFKCNRPWLIVFTTMGPVSRIDTISSIELLVLRWQDFPPCDFYLCLQWSHGLFCGLSICICLWLPLHNDHMVFLFLIFQSVFACDFHYTLITWSSLCDLSICICLWIPIYTDHMVFSLWSFTCDCERISFCDYHTWTCSPFQCEYVTL